MPTPRKISGYTVLSHIGEGAHSAIYAVQDPKTKQVWALKHIEINDEKEQRFFEQAQREYAIGSKLSHPGIRQLRKFIRHRKKFKVVGASLLMEFIDSTTLDQQLPRTTEDAVGIFLQVAEALGHMHEKGFVHADMKPTNVLIMEDGIVKVIDLGQACATGTIKKRIQGTPGYMAPEQAQRQAIDARTDIFNLGAMMYWVLVREVIPTAMPPQGGDAALMTTRDLEQVPAPTPPHEVNSRIPQALSDLVLDCVAMDVQDRPSSMLEVITTLTHIQTQQ
jgi:serine/threonine-protein kinase